MLNNLYFMTIKSPKIVITAIFCLTVFFLMQLGNLRWETDARVYLPKGHAAILYDEKVDEVFGVKNTILIGIVNEKKGIYNKETLERISRITEKVANLPGVDARRTIDVMSLSTASAFVGDEESIGTEWLMENVPTTQEEIELLKGRVNKNKDLFVGNIVSEDGKVAIIRAKLKEGIDNRYSTYFAIKNGILSAEGGQWDDNQAWEPGDWQSKSGQEGEGASQKTQWPDAWDTGKDENVSVGEDNGDQFYLAGRPVIEVTSGLNALNDIKVMVPLLLTTIVIALYFFFRTFRGVLLPLFIVTSAIIWTAGTMVLFDVPMYTISTMLPVILVTVGIGDAMHILSNYYDNVLNDPYRESRVIVTDVMKKLGAPLLTTSVTTGIGFLSLVFAEMPPFKIFGLFTVLGIVYCWLLSVTFIPSVLTLLKPKVGGYLKKRRSLRIHEEEGWTSRMLVSLGDKVNTNRSVVAGVLIVTISIAAYGSMSLYVDSSWMSDFRKDSEVALSSDILNERMDGTIFLNVVIEGDRPEILKSPELLHKIEALQKHIDSQPFVGGSLSIVDYLKSINMNLHEGQEKFKVLPDTQSQIAEYLFLLSMSGRPDLLKEVVDYEYRQANVSFLIKTDHTRELKQIIDEVNAFVDKEIRGDGIKVNLAGSANNSYVWADLLISSLAIAIMFSKLGIFLITSLISRSFILGFLMVMPVTVTTLLVAGVAGFMNIPLDVSTALAAGIAIGVGVDYSVHYLFRYRAEISENVNHLDATLITLRSVGKTIVFNAVVVTAGFLVLWGSKFPPHVKLGNFVAAYMVVSCLVALIILPLLTSYFSSRIIKKAS